MEARMSMLNKVLSKAQRYAKQHPDKVKKMTNQAARFADQRTKGKYSKQIDGAVRKVDGFTGGEGNDPGHEDGGPRNGPGSK